jgi:predicted GIY-YIG superfamily endonuclease
MGLVYLLHFERPISDRHTCQHYIGWCLDLVRRLAVHRAGQGARLTQVAVQRGIGFEVVRTWPGSRELERLLKDRKEGPALCPICCERQGRRLKSVKLPAEQQLALPFVEEPWANEPPPATKMDGWEFHYYRKRLAWTGPAPIELPDDLW